jgi:hypothetical protein
MRTVINKLDADFVNVKNKCRTTVGKEYTGNVPTSLFDLRLLISEHSPIRLINVDWSWKGIPSWVATHWSRHKWECFISTQRTDRTGVDREELSQDEPVDFDGYANAQHLIDTMRKRLCFQASPETRTLAEDLKEALTIQCPELAEVLVPNCIYRCGCPEFESCGYYQKYLNRCQEITTGMQKHVNLNDIAYRYEIYNDWFHEKRKG